MLELNKIYCGDCLELMQKMGDSSVDLVLTSPPYNTSRAGGYDVYNKRYTTYSDSIPNEDYILWTLKIFDLYDKILKPNGCVLYNLSYSGENADLIWLLISRIITETKFTTADCIIWKKNTAIPNNRSKNKLTRIVEFIFVFVRKEEFKTFNTNKQVKSIIKKTGQKNYENIYNFIEAKNNDGSNCLNKATFSTDLVEKLLDIYAAPDSVVYDSFMGAGTTAYACINKKLNYIGSELCKTQCEYIESQIKSKSQSRLF